MAQIESDLLLKKRTVGTVSQLASSQCQGKPVGNEADGLKKEDLACLTLFYEPFGNQFNSHIYPP